MKNKTSIFFFLLANLLLFVMACKPKKVIVAAPPVQVQTEKVNDQKLENFALLKGKNIDFSTLALKGKASLAINGDQNDVTMVIRILKDKKIWISVSAVAGIEVARTIITPDSLKLLNRLDKTYLKKPFSYLHDYTNKQIDFTLLQSVLSGNVYDGFLLDKSSLIQENGVWVLSGNVENLAFKTVFNTLLKLSETTLNDPVGAQGFKVVYDNYTPVSNSLFASSLKINTMSGDKKIDLGIEFNKIESNNPVDFPFNVPKSFQLIN